MYKHVWNNTEILYGYVETDTQNFEFTRQLQCSLEISKIHIFQKFYKMLEKFIMFIDKTL